RRSFGFVFLAADFLATDFFPAPFFAERLVLRAAADFFVFFVFFAFFAFFAFVFDFAFFAMIVLPIVSAQIWYGSSAMPFRRGATRPIRTPHSPAPQMPATWRLRTISHRLRLPTSG